MYHLKTYSGKLRLDDRASTGIEGLDEVIGGGFPKRSLVLLAGNPGTGKTAFSVRFLHKGAELGEPGLYVSLAESENVLVQNAYRHFGVDFRQLKREGKIRILDLVAMKGEGVSAAVEAIIDEIASSGAKRLIIDSFTAMAQAFKEPIDVRVIVHTVLSKMIGQLECTTIMVEEMPTGSERVGLGFEEFVADGVIVLRRGWLDGRLLRELELVKMRGVPLEEPKLIFTLKGGFKAFPPFRHKTIDKPKRFQPTPDPPGKFSTGIPDLDVILEGGYPRGSYNLLEVDSEVPLDAYGHIIQSAQLNFLANGNAFLSLPLVGLTPDQIRSFLTPYMDGEIFDRNARIIHYGTPTDKPYAVNVAGKTFEESFDQSWREIERLKDSRNKPVFSFIDLVTVEYVYSREAELRALGKAIANVRKYGDTRMNFAKPSVTLLKEFRDISDIHLRIRMVHGALVLYGAKPYTGLYNFDIDILKGYPSPKLTPIM